MKTDCFAYGNSVKCFILEEKNCDGCKFYKTVSQLEAEREKAKKRISSLSPETQAYISDKYGNLKFDF